MSFFKKRLHCFPRSLITFHGRHATRNIALIINKLTPRNLSCSPPLRHAGRPFVETNISIQKMLMISTIVHNEVLQAWIWSANGKWVTELTLSTVDTCPHNWVHWSNWCKAFSWIRFAYKISCHKCSLISFRYRENDLFAMVKHRLTDHLAIWFSSGTCNDLRALLLDLIQHQHNRSLFTNS